MDQAVAQRLGGLTKVPSLVLGCEPSISALHKGYSMIYSSHISWDSPTTPTPLELYPALAFDRLFRDEAGKGDASVLDLVLEEATAWATASAIPTAASSTNICPAFAKWKSGSPPRARRAGSKAGGRRSRNRTSTGPADGVPQDVAEHMRLMCDLLVLAFQTDTTRVCTLKLNNDHSAMRFPNLGIDYMIHHLLSHTDGADWLKVNQFFTEQVAYIAGRLDKIQEGERTALGQQR